jgi:cyanate permease
MLCAYSILYGLTQWLQAGRGISSREAGLLLLPMSIVSILITQPVSQRNLVRGPLIVASVASILGSIGILLLGTGSPITWVVAIRAPTRLRITSLRRYRWSYQLAPIPCGRSSIVSSKR